MDIATLGIRVENGQAVQNLKAMDTELRRVAESGTAVSDTTRKIQADIIRANGGFERYRQIQKQIADEMRQADAVAAEYASTLNKVETNTNNGAIGVNRFRSSLSTLAAQAVGTTSSVGQLGGLLGQFALGGAITSVVLIGIAAIAKAYEALSAGAVDAKKKVDDLIRSLVAQRQAAFDASLGGAGAIQSAAEVRESQALDALNRTKFLAANGSLAERAIAYTKLKAAQKDYDDAVTASAQAASNTLQLQLDDEKRLAEERKKAAEDAKRAARERETEDNKELARLAAKVAILSKIKIDFGGNQGAFDRIGQNPLIGVFGGAASPDVPGNIDLTHRPRHVNEDGSISTVRSMSFNEDGLEILVPTISGTGILMTEAQAIEAYHKTGQFLGKFKNETDASNYAQRLHEAQAAMIDGRGSGIPEIGIPISGTFDKDNIPIPGVGMSLKQLDEVFAELHKKQADERDQRLRDEQEAKKAAERYTSDMKSIVRGGLIRLFTDGTKSFRDFFEDLGRLFSNLMTRMEQEGKTKGLAYKSLGIASSAITAGFAGYNVGQQVGNAASGGIGGAANGALLGYAIAGPLGAIVGGVTGLVGGLIGGAEAARAHAKALIEATKQLKENLATFHFAATGTTGSLPDQIRQAQSEADVLRTQAQDVHAARPHGFFDQFKPDAGLEAALAQITADEAAYVERLKEEDAIKRKQYTEDLQVRLLRAQGHDKEADALALQLQQAREYQEAMKAGADAATLALLAQVQAAEKVKSAVDALKTSVSNAPTGFVVERYIRQFAAPRFQDPGISIPYVPQSPGKYPKATTVLVLQEGALKGAFPIDGNASRVEIANKVADGLRSIASSTLGINVPLADVLDYAGTN